MDEKKITLFGEELSIAYNLAVQILVEKITDKPFDVAELAKTTNRVVLYYACIYVGNPNTAITLDKLANELTFEDMQVLDKAVNDVMKEWYEIPKTARLDAPSEGNEEEEQQKNA